MCKALGGSVWKMKKRYILLAVGISLFVFMVFREGPKNILNTVLRSDLLFLLLAEILLLSVALLKGLRLHTLVSPIKKISSVGSFKVFFLGQLINQGLVSTAGDIGKPVMFKKLYNFKFSKALSAVVTERVFDFSFILFLSSFIFLIVTGVSVKFAIIFPLLVLFVIFAVILSPENWINKFSRFERLHEAVQDFRKYVKNLNTETIGFVGVLTITAWAFEGIGNTLLFYSFGVEIGFHVVLVITAVSLLVGFASMVPGGLGTREAAMVLLYSEFGIGGGVVISVALLYRFLIALNDGLGYIISEGLEGLK